MNSEQPWRFSESRPIRRFRRSEHALDRTEFRVRDDLEYTRTIPWRTILQPEDIAEGSFRPSFRLDVDEDQLQKDVGIDPADLQLGLTIRDPAILNRRLIRAWQLKTLPGTVDLSKEDLGGVSGLRGLEFVLQVTPSKILNVGFRTASRPGQTVASRIFSIDAPFDGAGFPVRIVDPADFEEIGLPPETVWVIRWLSTDFDKPADLVLCVYINREEASKMLRLSTADSVGRVLSTEIAVEIFLARISDLAMVLYRQDKSPRLDFWGSDVRSHTTEGDTQWVNYKPSPFSSPSMAF